MTLTDLPPELLEEIFLHCDPHDIGVLAQCCSYFHTIIYAPENPAASIPFWRALYLSQPLDDPRASLTPLGLPRPVSDDLWRTRLQRLTRVRTLLENDVAPPADELETLIECLLDMVTFVVPLRALATGQIDVSSSLLWAMVLLLRDNALFGETSSTPRATQLLARLHTLCGPTPRDFDPALRVRSRAAVYDLRRYRPETSYGPFLPGGGVDWVMMYQLHHVMAMHFTPPQEDNAVVLYPMSLPFTQLVMLDGEEARKDWAGVAGRWHIAFCYCDHRELIQYNSTATTPDAPLDTSMFEDPDFVEICRTLPFELVPTRFEPDAQHPEHPIIHFEAVNGEALGMTIQGIVSVTPDIRKKHFSR
ncbi:hypothetical protein HDZ31DRAFT_67369 [Schizophyllum fasciatum]